MQFLTIDPISFSSILVYAPFQFFFAFLIKCPSHSPTHANKKMWKIISVVLDYWSHIFSSVLVVHPFPPPTPRHPTPLHLPSHPFPFSKPTPPSLTPTPPFPHTPFLSSNPTPPFPSHLLPFLQHHSTISLTPLPFLRLKSIISLTPPSFPPTPLHHILISHFLIPFPQPPTPLPYHFPHTPFPPLPSQFSHSSLLSYMQSCMSH